MRNKNYNYEKTAIIELHNNIKTGGEFDIHSMIPKLHITLPFQKYPNEMHVPGYNYLGPLTRTDIRLKDNTFPKPGEEPINNTDAAALSHDVSYGNFEKMDLKGKELLDAKHNADKVLIDEFDTLPTDSFMEKIVRFFAKNLMRAKVKLGLGTKDVNNITLSDIGITNDMLFKYVK